MLQWIFFRQNSSFLDIRTLGVTLFRQISLYGREEYTVWPSSHPGKGISVQIWLSPWAKKNLKLQQPKPNQKLEIGYPGCFMKISIIYFLHFPISGSGGPKPFCIIRVCRFFTFHHVSHVPSRPRKIPKGDGDPWDPVLQTSPPGDVRVPRWGTNGAHL